ncbi:unnamed protein product [Closterium sp. NIES-65]|nr:unnamed protein product [Closterium sp. NIES-65]
MLGVVLFHSLSLSDTHARNPFPPPSPSLSSPRLPHPPFLPCLSSLVTIQMLGVVLNQSSPEELQSGASLRSGAAEIVREVARQADVYLMAQVHSDESEATILSALEEASLFSLPDGSPGPINRDKVLFCEKDVGVASFVRQLEPDWHFEAFDTTVEQLRRFVKYILHITPAATGAVAANVVSVPSLEAYFGSPSS